MIELNQHIPAELEQDSDEDSAWSRIATHGDSPDEIRRAWLNIARISGADQVEASAELDSQLAAIMRDMAATAPRAVH